MSPAPWKLDGLHLRDRDGFRILTFPPLRFSFGSGGPGVEDQKENRRAIEAAPKLLSTLKDLRDWIPQWMEGPEVDSVLADIDAVINPIGEVK